MTKFRDLGITVDLSHTDPVLAAGLLRAHDLHTMRVHPTLKDALEDVFGNRRLEPNILARCPDVGTRLIVTALCPPTEKLPMGKAQCFDLVTAGRPALVILIPIPGLIELRS